MAQKINPKQREAIREFLATAVDRAFDGVEEQYPGLEEADLTFDAANELVTCQVKLVMPLYWVDEDVV